MYLTIQFAKRLTDSGGRVGGGIANKKWTESIID